MVFPTVYPPPPNTTNYYIAGYSIFFIVMIVYISILFIRYRNLKNEYDLLIELDQES